MKVWTVRESEVGMEMHEWFRIGREHVRAGKQWNSFLHVTNRHGQTATFPASECFTTIEAAQAAYRRGRKR
jgi:hypothetical protein